MSETKLADSVEAETDLAERVSIYCLLDLQTLSQLWFTWLCWHESRGKVSCYRFPCPITQGLKSVWTCPFQHLSASQRLLPAFKRSTLPSSLTLQGTCGRMQQSALWLSVWICIKFLRMHACYNVSKAFQVRVKKKKSNTPFEVQKSNDRTTFCFYSSPINIFIFIVSYPSPNYSCQNIHDVGWCSSM